MKKMVIGFVVVAVALVAISFATKSDAQFGALKQATQGNVGGAADQVLQDKKNAEKEKCRADSRAFSDDVEYNAVNGGPDKIEAKFGKAKYSQKDPEYKRGEINISPDTYLTFSCSKQNCSVNCYNR